MKNDRELNGPVARDDGCGRGRQSVFSWDLSRNWRNVLSKFDFISSHLLKDIVEIFRRSFVRHSGNHSRGENYSDSELAFRRKIFFPDFSKYPHPQTFMQTNYLFVLS